MKSIRACSNAPAALGTGRDPGFTCHCPEFPGALPVLASLLSRASTPSRGQMSKKPAVRAHFHTGQLPQAHAAPRSLLPTPCPHRLEPQLGLSIEADGSGALPSCPRVASRPTPPTLHPVSFDRVKWTNFLKNTVYQNVHKSNQEA